MVTIISDNDHEKVMTWPRSYFVWFGSVIIYSWDMLLPAELSLLAASPILVCVLTLDGIPLIRKPRSPPDTSVWVGFVVPIWGPVATTLSSIQMIWLSMTQGTAVTENTTAVHLNLWHQSRRSAASLIGCDTKTYIRSCGRNHVTCCLYQRSQPGQTKCQ